MQKHILTQAPLLQPVLIGLFLLFGFLSFNTTSYALPWNNFSMEAFAFLSVFALLLSSIKNLRLRLEQKTCFLLALIAVATISYIFQKDALREDFYLFLLYIITAIALCGYQIKEGSKIANSYLLMIIFAGLVNAVVICAQQWDLIAALPFASASYNPKISSRPYGNFGQANLAATFVFTSMLCSLYFYKKRKVNFFLHGCIISLGALALAFTASRTAFLSLAILVGLSLIIRDWRALISFFFIGLIILIARAGTPVGENRPIIGADLSGGRFDLWGIIVDGLMQSPWLGYGVLNTSLAQFSVVDRNSFLGNKIISSAHNIFLDFFSWFGIPLGLIISGFFIFVAIGYLRAIKNKALFYLIIPIIIHSLLEYPLQNANFLFLFFILLSIIGGESTIVGESSVGRVQRVASYFFFMVAVTMSALVVYDYSRLSRSYMDLRFFNKHIVGVDKPSKLDPLVLDKSIGQFNFFLVNQINSENEAKELSRLTPHSPAFRNFLLLTQYYRKLGIRTAEVYWINKANGYWPAEYMAYIRNPNLTSVEPIAVVSATNTAP